MDNRRVTLTKRILHETLIEALKTTPLSKITVKKLCNKADLNRSTFYAHYADVYELFNEFEDSFLTHVFFFSSETNQKEKLSGIRNCVHYIWENKDAFVVLVHNGHLFTKLASLSLQFCNSSQPAESNTPLLISYTVTGSIALLYEWIENPAICSEDEIANLILELSTHAGKLT